MKLNEGTGKFIMYGVIGLALLLLVWKFVLKKSPEEKERAKDVAGKKEEADKSARVVKPSYSEQYYRDLASQLYSAMETWGYTDEDSIARIFTKMQNVTDVLKLEAAFGNRDDKTLKEYLQSELSDSDIEKYVNGPLRKNGITAASFKQ